MRNGSDSAVRAVPAISRKRLARAQTLDFVTSRHVRLDGLQGRQSDDDDEDQRGPGECRIGGSHQGPTIHGAPQPSFAMKYHGGIVPGLG